MAPGDEPTAKRDSRPEGALQVEHATLGREVHTFVGRPPVTRSPPSLLVLGVVSAVMVPIGIKYVPGTLGSVVAVIGALVAIVCYWLSGARRRGSGIDIRIFERGISCAQGKATRELFWNEIVEVTGRRINLPGGKVSMAIAFEVVGAPPLLIVVGAPFSDAQHTRQLVDALSEVWLHIWCRRARAVLQAKRGLQIGRASLTFEGATFGSLRIAWEDILGVEGDEPAERLSTSQGVLEADPAGGNVPFPSAAQRICALAKAGPLPPVLPGN